MTPVRNYSAQVWGINAAGIRMKVFTLWYRSLVLLPIARGTLGELPPSRV